MVGERRAVAARSGFHAGVVELRGDGEGVVPGQVERNEGGAPGGVSGPVDGDASALR